MPSKKVIRVFKANNQPYYLSDGFLDEPVAMVSDRRPRDFKKLHS